ncbi:MAG: hypothetical protein FWE67_09355, partial [Planctomycetaceae bacterium]|nr:hypothetical protein [Planctomycetaceae bacterium]
MNQKTYRFASIFLLGLLLLPLSCTQKPPSYLAGTPALTGIPIDKELAQLLSQIVPYNPPEKNALPEEKRFLFNLNKLLNEDLKEQYNKYKLAAAKLSLRTALALSDKIVDSIEVRWDPWGRGHEKDVWGLGIPNMRGTCHFFTVSNGRIAKIGLYVETGTCGGMFSDCCGSSGEYPHGINDTWFQHFVDLGRQEDFPFSESEYTPK